MIYIGLDLGSITGKAVVVDEGGAIQTTLVLPAGYNRAKTAATLMDAALSRLGVSRESVAAVCATGYGRKAVEFADFSVTEITCHGRGAAALVDGVDTVIDIGGQDCKGISLSTDGAVQDFVMNDKCAAGTGRFLEVMARALEVDLDEFEAFDARAATPASVSSVCTVFAESEVITLASRGVDREEIIAGVHQSIAERIAGMIAPLPQGTCWVMTGGVSLNGGVVRALERRIGIEVTVPQHAQCAGALGAALIARERHAS